MDAPFREPESPSYTYIRAPLTSVSPTDQSGIIAILTGFSLGLVLLSTGVRLYAKRTAGGLRYDDVAFYAAVAVAVAQAGVVCFLVSEGWGRVTPLIDRWELRAIRRGELASNLLYIFVLAFSKISCATMFLAITPYKKQNLVAWVLLGAAIVWLVTSLFLEGFQCHTFPLRCSGFYPRWLYISILDILLEAALVAHGIYLILPRQMPLASKLTIIFAFCCRLPNIVCTILRLIYLDAPLTPRSSSFYSARLQAVTQLAIAYTITSCVIPYLRPLMQAHENADGSLRRPSGKGNFKLSQSSAVSGTSGARKYFRIGCAASAPNADMGVRGNTHRTAVSATYEDIGNLLQPVRPPAPRSRSEEPVPVSARSAGLNAIDWDLEAEIRPVVPTLPPLLKVNPKGPSSLSEPWRKQRPEARSARSGEKGGSFTTQDFV